MIDYFVRALPLIMINVGVSLIPVSGLIVWESINRFQFQVAHLSLIPAQNPVDFIFCYAYIHSQCHYGINCRFFHRCMICNRGFHLARLCPRHSNSRESSWFPGAADETSNYRPPHLQRKESLVRIWFLVIKSLISSFVRNSCVAKF